MLQPGIQDRTRWWSREDLLLVLLLGALLYLPGLGDVPLFDRDEPRFATAGRNMAVTGDYIVPRFNDQLRPDKPPLLYWLQCGVYHIARWIAPQAEFSELIARLPSAICATLTLVVVYLMAGSRFGRVTGLVSALILGTCCVFLAEARLSTADATMLLFQVLAMACAWSAFERGAPLADTFGPGYRRGLPKPPNIEDPYAALDFEAIKPPATGRLPLWVALLFWIALGFATLAKGMPLLFVPLALLTLSATTGRLGAEVRRHANDFFRRRNVLVALLLLLPLGFIYAVPGVKAQRSWISILWVIGCLMIALPHLPSYLWRYGGRMGNWRWWGQLRPLLGIPLLLLIVLPWFIAAWVQTDGKLIEIMLRKHVVARAVSSLEGHGQPPGFYLLTVWGTFWPWSILLIPAAYHTARRLLGKTAVLIDPRPYQFLVCWIFPAWLIYELAKTKLVHYTLPLLVPIAVLCADTLVQSWLRLTEVLSTKWFASAKWVWLSLWSAFGVAIPVLAFLHLRDVFGWSILLGGALAATGVASTIAWNRPAWPFVMVLSWAAALLIANTLILPEIRVLNVSKTLAATVLRIQQQDPSFRVAAAGYNEDTLVFYTRQQVTMLGEKPPAESELPQWARYVAAAAHLQKPGGPEPAAKWLLITQDYLLPELQRQGYEFWEVAAASGFNIAKGKPVAVTVITNVRPPGWNPPSTRPATTHPAPKWW